MDNKKLSLDIFGNLDGGGVCEECQHFTEGINCETCIFGYFRPVGILPNATEPCIRKLLLKSFFLCEFEVKGGFFIVKKLVNVVVIIAILETVRQSLESVSANLHSG